MFAPDDDGGISLIPILGAEYNGLQDREIIDSCITNPNDRLTSKSDKVVSLLIEARPGKCLPAFLGFVVFLQNTWALIFVCIASRVTG